MNLIQIDQEKCIQCGRCAKVCPMGVIDIDNHEPQTIKQFCFSCGHCVAVCPREAIDNIKAPLANQIPIETTPVLDPGAAKNFLRSRRSIRDYQQKTVPREKILQLLDIARFAPTAANSQGVAYHIIDDPNMLHNITTAGINWIEEQIETSIPDIPHFAELVNVVDNYRKTGRNVVLWNAPCLIVAVVEQDFLFVGRDNAHFSLAYAELYAPSLGLGTCWAGVIESSAASSYKPLLKLLDLPKNMCVVGALMVGYPQYRHKRLVDRAPLQVTWQNTTNH
jgi:nitroreductase/NAD-dependent dihydropyrimidine dehydrogenase PreA subunit